MSGEIFLDKYKGESVDELIALESTHRIDSLVLAFESAIDKKKDAGEALSETEIAIVSIEAMEREVNNGGFGQFFYNSSVEFVPTLVDSLKRIKCTKTAELAEKAISALELDSLDSDSIEEKMWQDDEDLENKLDGLDSQYYVGEEDISGLLFSYIKEHRAEIKIA